MHHMTALCQSVTMRILVIERDPGLREFFRVLFGKDIVDLPATPQEARRHLIEQSYDLLVLDEDNGVLEEQWGLLARPRCATLLIAPATVVISANPEAPLFVFPKPFSVAQLLCAVDAMRVPQTLS